MPALTVYAHPPVHNNGWTSLTTKPSSCSGSALAPASAPITQIPGRPRSTKARFERLTKPLSSSASRLKKSKSANNCQLQQQQQQQPDIIIATPRPQAAVRGILTKHSSLLNLSPRPSAKVESSPAVVLEPTIVEPLSLSPARESQVVVTKKVRFSGDPQDGLYGRMGGCGSCGHPGGSCKSLSQGQSSQGGGCTEEERCRRPEPVIETIFLTYSRFAYDRSPIAVDRVFNKSLALPPRTDQDDLRGGRWLADLLPTSSTDRPCISSDNRLMTHPFPSDLVDDHLNAPKLLRPLSPVLAPADQLIVDNTPPILVAADCPQSAASWQIRPDLFNVGPHPSLSEDGMSESTSSSSSQESPTTPAIADLLMEPMISYTHQLTDIVLAPSSATTPSGHSTSPPPPFSLSVQNLAHHALSNLNLQDLPFPPSHHQSIVSCLPVDLQPLCGFGNWNRSQVFDSCDVLDGF